ncbi:MAG: histidine kinase [Clostridiales bacterium]|nr:histidine kinase [Clostridiales bacterium]
MKKRLLLRVVILSLIPFLILGMIYYGNSMLRDWHSALKYSMSQLSSVLDSSFRKLTLIADNLSIHTVVQSSMSHDGRKQSRNDQIDELRELDRLLRQFENQKEVYDIRLYFANDKLYTTEQISYFPFSVFETDEHCPDPAPVGQISGIYKRDYKDKPSAQVFTYYKLIPSTNYTLSTVGALCVDMNADILSAQLNTPQGGLSTLALLDKTGNVVLLAGEERSKEEYQQVVQSDISGDESLPDRIIVYPLSQVNWVLAGWIGPYSFWDGITNRFFIAALIVMTAVILLVILIVTNAFAKRVELLVGLLEPQNGGIVAPTKNENTSLVGHLNESINHAKQLITLQKQQVVLQQQTQLKLLQAQINPHFLYNALDCANWLVREGNQAQASEVIIAIGKYYRLVLSKGRDNLTVEEDLELALTYLQIQESRLKSRINLQSHIQEQAKNCLIPKMTMQPIVENCVVHGFINGLDDARIDIDIYTADGFLYIVIFDNGIGMSAETASHLLDHPTSTSSFGLYSVHQRCILFSGREDCGVSVESEPGEYTMVTVKLFISNNDAAIIEQS